MLQYKQNIKTELWEKAPLYVELHKSPNLHKIRIYKNNFMFLSSA